MSDSVTVESSSLVLAILLKDRRMLKNLVQFLKDREIGFEKIQVVFSFDRGQSAYVESDQTLFVMSTGDFEKAKEAGLDVHLYDFSLPKMRNPDPTYQQRNLHFKGFPRSWTPEDIEGYLKDVAYLFVSPEDVSFRVKRDETGSKGFGELIFKTHVPDNTVKSVMALLMDTPVDDSHVIHCQWSQVKSRTGNAFNKIYLKQH